MSFRQKLQNFFPISVIPWCNSSAPTLSMTTSSLTALHTVGLSINTAQISVECHYAECRYAECHYAEYRYAECCYVRGVGVK